MSEIIDQIGEMQREVDKGRIPAGEANVVRLRRTYQAEIEDVWEAVTDPERIGRWFLPVTGDLSALPLSRWGDFALRAAKAAQGHLDLRGESHGEGRQ